MLRRLIQISFVIVGGALGVLLMPLLFGLIKFHHFLLNNSYSYATIGALLFYFLTFWMVDYVENFIKWTEEKLVKTPIGDILFGTLGLLLGLIIAFLVTLPFSAIEVPILDTVLPLLLTVVLGYLGLVVAIKKRQEVIGLFNVGNKKSKKHDADELYANKKKILDTSVIIDGRIADICSTGFLEGTIVIPHFVLSELQYIADSSDNLKRARGRRGLDILNRIQKEIPIKVEMFDGDFPEVQEVDAKLIRLAKKIDGILVTNDFNLNKVSEFQNVKVLNINDLANAVKPAVIPGEDMQVLVIKDGKEHNQGIAYLDDGTMIVVDDGKNFVGKNIRVTVTSVLQTSAGRMIFAKPQQKTGS
ncbi:MAG: hypothetical protein K0R71_2035 [Bacillales bacterium]|nr:hypothetical protein [Bacillales bacterium]